MCSKYTFLLFTLVFSFVITGCSKSKKEVQVKTIDSSGLFYTSRIGGIRLWHGNHDYQAYGIHFPIPINESYALPDTSFAITILGDSLIQLGVKSFRYEQTDTLKRIYYFGMAYYFYHYRTGEGVAYFYDKDSIVYCQGDIHHTDDFWQISDVYHTD